MNFSKVLPGLLFTAFPVFLFAGGFQIGLQGARQNGMAQCGTALSQDASSLFFNPGAANFLDSASHINVGASLVFANVFFQSQDGFSTARNQRKTGTPIFFYLSHRFKTYPKLTVGISINNPFGASLRYADDWQGRYVIKEISLKTFSFQPTIAYKVTDKIGVGAGLSIYTGDLYLRRAIPTTDSTGMGGEALLTGRSTSLGFNLGVMYKPSAKLQFGLNFRSNVNLKLKSGTAQFQVPASLSDSFPINSFNSAIRLPYVLSLGAAYKPIEQLTLALDVNYTGWSSYDTLKFDYAVNSVPLKDTKLTRAYKNVFCFRFGTEYVVSKSVMVRAGAYYDLSPMDAQYLSPESPDANRLGITGGLSIRPTATLAIDAAVVYTSAKARSGGQIENGFYGSFKSAAIIPSFGLHILF